MLLSFMSKGFLKSKGGVKVGCLNHPLALSVLKSLSRHNFFCGALLMSCERPTYRYKDIDAWVLYCQGFRIVCLGFFKR